MKNKKAEGKISGLTLVIIAVVLIGGFMYFNNAKTTTNTTITQPNNLNNPSIGYVITDAVTNAAVTGGTTYFVVTNSNGNKYLATNASYTAVAGDTLVALNDPTGNYLADDTTAGPLVNGPQTVNFQVYGYANVSITAKDDPVSSSNTLTTGGGANNLTHIVAGGSRKVGLILQGTTQKNSGKMFWTFETPANTGTNVSTVSLTCGGVQVNPVALPGCLTAANAASKITAWEIPAIVGFGETDCTVNIQATATGSLGAGSYVFKEYAEQKFFDSTDTLQEGICDTTVNGNNANKYQDSQSLTVGMTA